MDPARFGAPTQKSGNHLRVGLFTWHHSQVLFGIKRIYLCFILRLGNELVGSND